MTPLPEPVPEHPHPSAHVPVADPAGRLLAAMLAVADATAADREPELVEVAGRS